MAVINETMYGELDTFGVGYEFPAYCMISNRCGFISSGRFDKWGFIAADSNDESIIFTEHSLMGALVGDNGGEKNTIYQISVEKIKISKALLLPNYTVDIVYRSEGKKKNYRFSLNTKVKGFPEQEQNVHGLITLLKKWAY
ncbi:MAG: hypothetical protein E7497_05760 [Ruminococcus sp.]|nr:hypothetical protein [Ruminococcus sp.]